MFNCILTPKAHNYHKARRYLQFSALLSAGYIILATHPIYTIRLKSFERFLGKLHLSANKPL